MHPWAADPRGNCCRYGSRRDDRAEILEAFPDLEREDIREALQYAAEAVRERGLPLVTTP